MENKGAPETWMCVCVCVNAEFPYTHTHTKASALNVDSLDSGLWRCAWSSIGSCRYQQWDTINSTYARSAYLAPPFFFLFVLFFVFWEGGIVIGMNGLSNLIMSIVSSPRCKQRLMWTHLHNNATSGLFVSIYKRNLRKFKAGRRRDRRKDFMLGMQRKSLHARDKTSDS